MTGLRRGTVVTALAVAATLAGCSPGAASPEPSSGRIDHPTGTNDLVLRISTRGGLLPPDARLTELPVLSLYGDGRLITQGPQVAIYPGPAVPSLQVTRLSDAGIQRLLRAAEDAGLLGPDRHYDYPGIADAPTTTFTVVAAGGRHEVSAYALWEGTDPGRLPETDWRARQALLSFQRQLTHPRSWLGGDLEAEDRPYEARAMRIVVAPGDPRTAPDQSLVNVRDWPLTRPLRAIGEPRGRGVARCGVLTGEELASVRDHLQASNQLTFWRSEGRTYRLMVRPLLPDEQGCPQE